MDLRFYCSKWSERWLRKIPFENNGRIKRSLGHGRSRPFEYEWVVCKVEGKSKRSQQSLASSLGSGSYVEVWARTWFWSSREVIPEGKGAIRLDFGAALFDWEGRSQVGEERSSKAFVCSFLLFVFDFFVVFWVFCESRQESWVVAYLHLRRELLERVVAFRRPGQFRVEVIPSF